MYPLTDFVIFIYFRSLFELSFWFCLVIASMDVLFELLVLTKECNIDQGLILVLIKKFNI